ncbi:MAG: DNA mismatch repair endonuclease MutH [Thalassotalea sp.]
MTPIIPPKNEQELLQRAHKLSGLTLGEIAQQAGIKVPNNLNKEKGWVGLLLEHVLGASAGSKPEPDFPDLGIELKSLPINHLGKPLETTFVCIAPLIGLTGVVWENSHLKNKLARVLWVPVVAERNIPIAQRIVATPFIWSPNAEEEHQLARDWQDLTDMIVLGKVEEITGKQGDILQLRPKAANANVKTKAFNHKGEPFLTLPRGFYLKTGFTQALIHQHLRVD